MKSCMLPSLQFSCYPTLQCNTTPSKPPTKLLFPSLAPSLPYAKPILPVKGPTAATNHRCCITMTAETFFLFSVFPSEVGDSICNLTTAVLLSYCSSGYRLNVAYSSRCEEVPEEVGVWSERRRCCITEQVQYRTVFESTVLRRKDMESPLPHLLSWSAETTSPHSSPQRFSQETVTVMLMLWKASLDLVLVPPVDA
jgi:hypothetical protein